jgi:hypothetical protein
VGIAFDDVKSIESALRNQGTNLQLTGIDAIFFALGTNVSLISKPYPIHEVAMKAILEAVKSLKQQNESIPKVFSN